MLSLSAQQLNLLVTFVTAVCQTMTAVKYACAANHTVHSAVLSCLRLLTPSHHVYFKTCHLCAICTTRQTLSKGVTDVLQVTNSTAREMTVNSSSRRLLADAVSVTPTATSTLHTSAFAVDEHLLHVAQTQCAYTASKFTQHSLSCYSTRY